MILLATSFYLMCEENDNALRINIQVLERSRYQIQYYYGNLCSQAYLGDKCMKSYDSKGLISFHKQKITSCWYESSILPDLKVKMNVMTITTILKKT